MKKWAGNILLFLGATIVSLLALEFALRIIYPAHESWRFYRIPDAEMGWVLEPNAEFTRQVLGAFVSVRYNSHGFRDSPFPDTPPENATRIVVLGDSYMEANMVPLEEVFHKQLERQAAGYGRRVKTWNLGVAGYGTLQEYLAFLKEGAKQKPHLVLLAFYMHNDVKNNSEHLNVLAQAKRKGKRKRPFLDEDDESQWRILKPDYNAMQKRFLRRKNSLLFRIRHNSVLLSLFRNARRALRANVDAFNNRALARHRCSSATEYKKAWRTTDRILLRLRKDVEQAGAKLVVFSVPALFDADRRVVADYVNSTPKAEGQICAENSPGYARLREILEAGDIAYVDLVPAFRQAVSQEGQDLFVHGDWHWNGSGHALAAQRVYEALKSRRLLPDG